MRRLLLGALLFLLSPISAVAGDLSCASFTACSAATQDQTFSGTNTFSGSSLFTGRADLPGSNTPPATCTGGKQVYIDTDATSGSRLLICESTNTWVAQGGSSGANTALSNLASVSINSDLLPSGTGREIGAQATPFEFLWLHGAGTYGTGSLKLTGTPTGHRVITFPDATDTVAALGTAQTWSATQTFGGVVVTSNQQMGGAYLRFGGTDIFEVQSALTPDSMVVALGTASRTFHLYENADDGYDFQNCGAGTSAATNPTLCGHSATTNTTGWWSITHDNSNTLLNTGTGNLTVNTGFTAAGTGSIGWSAVAGTNTACNTTCTFACVFGMDSVTAGILACTDATADICLCAGAN